MRKIICLFFLMSFIMSFGQEQSDEEYYEDDYNEYQEEDYEKDYTEFYNDTIKYTKTLNYSKKRDFDSDLKSKYNERSFNYVDNLKKKEPKKQDSTKNNELNIGFLKGLASFMSTIFPYLLGLIVVLILVKSFIKTDTDLWNFRRSTKKVANKELVYEENDNLNENDYDRLLRKAIEDKDFRLATRFYYLSILKRLAKKELISYHKDKTNTQYQFELKNKQMRIDFAYLAYLYDYVWYGEFPVDISKFALIEEKYKSFIQTIN